MDAKAETPEWVWPEIEFRSLPPRPSAIPPNPIPPPQPYLRLHDWFRGLTVNEAFLSLAELLALIDRDAPAFRVVQGASGGLLMPVAMTILLRAAGPDRIGRLMTPRLLAMRSASTRGL
ncbi:hypothetical protein [Nocardia sp. CC227C]|uniref:hypothetical protein n=1 Tax=Nocardia sp. CC227C TaxID=3044562 RepID=UPI00278BEF58|nr:hypothetical protein [Nocardia sp. CC227C]